MSACAAKRRLKAAYGKAEDDARLETSRRPTLQVANDT